MLQLPGPGDTDKCPACGYYKCGCPEEIELLDRLLCMVCAKALAVTFKPGWASHGVCLWCDEVAPLYEVKVRKIDVA